VHELDGVVDERHRHRIARQLRLGTMRREHDDDVRAQALELLRRVVLPRLDERGLDAVGGLGERPPLVLHPPADERKAQTHRGLE
jgi:hypothetical protein